MMSSPPVTNKEGVLIVNYHYVTPARGQVLPGLRGVTPDDLERQLLTLKHHFEPLSPCELPLPSSSSGKGDGMRYLITFDDACLDLREWALPLLLQLKIPAIIFCCSQPYVEHRVLNVQKTHLLYGCWGWKRFNEKFQAALDCVKEPWESEDSGHLGLARMYRYDSDETATFKRQLNVELPYPVVGEVLDLLFEEEFGPQEEMVKRLYLSPDEIRRCADCGVDIGLHTHSHPMLSRLSLEEQTREFDLALAFFREELDLNLTTVSYPYGIKGSWNVHTKHLAATRRLNAGFTLGRQVYDPSLHLDPYEIPRYDVNDIFGQDGGLVSELL